MMHNADETPAADKTEDMHQRYGNSTSNTAGCIRRVNTVARSAIRGQIHAKWQRIGDTEVGSTTSCSCSQQPRLQKEGHDGLAPLALVLRVVLDVVAVLVKRPLGHLGEAHQGEQISEADLQHHAHEKEGMAKRGDTMAEDVWKWQLSVGRTGWRCAVLARILSQK